MIFRILSILSLLAVSSVVLANPIQSPIASCTPTTTNSATESISAFETSDTPLNIEVGSGCFEVLAESGHGASQTLPTGTVTFSGNSTTGQYQVKFSFTSAWAGNGSISYGIFDTVADTLSVKSAAIKTNTNATNTSIYETQTDYAGNWNTQLILSPNYLPSYSLKASSTNTYLQSGVTQGLSTLGAGIGVVDSFDLYSTGVYTSSTDTFTATQLEEPVSILLLGVGLLGLVASRKKPNVFWVST